MGTRSFTFDWSKSIVILLETQASSFLVKTSHMGYPLKVFRRLVYLQVRIRFAISFKKIKEVTKLDVNGNLWMHYLWEVYWISILYNKWANSEKENLWPCFFSIELSDTTHLFRMPRILFTLKVFQMNFRIWIRLYFIVAWVLNFKYHMYTINSLLWDWPSRL